MHSELNETHIAALIPCIYPFCFATRTGLTIKFTTAMPSYVSHQALTSARSFTSTQFCALLATQFQAASITLSVPEAANVVIHGAGVPTPVPTLAYTPLKATSRFRHVVLGFSLCVACAIFTICATSKGLCLDKSEGETDEQQLLASLGMRQRVIDTTMAHTSEMSNQVGIDAASEEAVDPIAEAMAMESTTGPPKERPKEHAFGLFAGTDMVGDAR